MSSIVQICNMALGHIGSKSTILDIDEASTEAHKCKLYYESARRATLESHNWGFAKRTIALAEIGTPPPTWVYQYAYPASCITVREILPRYRTDDPIPFEVAHSDVNDAAVILTDEEAAIVQYTKNVTAATLFTPSFTIAFSAKLAYFIAMPLTGKPALRDLANDIYIKAIVEAKVNDNKQNQFDKQPEASWHQDRN